MAKKIRKVFRRSYDKCVATDYIGDIDNLNPKRNTDLEQQIEEITNECRARLNRVERKYNLEDELSKFTVRPSSLSDMQSEINELLKKLNTNPAKRLYDMGLNPSSMMADDTLDLNHPPVINCYGIDTVGSDNGEGTLLIDFNNENADENNIVKDEDALIDGLSDDELDRIYTITYHLNGAEQTDLVSTWPQTYTMRNASFILYSGLTFPDIGTHSYKFGGWYLDANYSTKIIKNRFKGYQRDVDLYAYKTDIEDEDEGDDTEEQNYDGSLPADLESCAVKELEWLKIVLAVVSVIKILLKIVTTILGIIVPLINIVKEAQLAWVNPALMASIIQRVSQKLMALVFSIIGTLLMKLWSLLNFDCISTEAAEVIAQINEILSGVLGTIGSLDELACVGEDLGEGITDAWQGVKESMEDQYNQLKQNWSKEAMTKQFGEAWGKACGEWKEVFTNPKKLYNASVPAEIRDQIATIIDGYQTASETVNAIGTVAEMFATSHCGYEPKKKVKGMNEQTLNPKGIEDPAACASANSEPVKTEEDASTTNKKETELNDEIANLKKGLEEEE